MAFGSAPFARGAFMALVLALSACGQAEGYLLGGALQRTDGIMDPPGAAKLHVGSCSTGADLELIDDMEDGNQAILQTAGRAGSWFSFNDQTGTQNPLANSSIFPMYSTEPARDGSLSTVQTTGTEFTGWGAGVGFELSSTLPYNASRYTGIAFWARAAAGKSFDLRFNVTDRNTSQYGKVCDLDCQPDVGPRGTNAPTDGHCSPEAGPCYDDFGVDLASAVGESWQLFMFPWDKLAAKNWSHKDLPGIAEEALYGIRVQANGPSPGVPAVAFDFMIDDVAFLCH